MNDITNLTLYGQLVVFKSDEPREEVIWHNPDISLQRTLQSLAHHLELEYEYSLGTRDVRVTRTAPVQHLEDFEFMDFTFLPEDSQLAEINASINQQQTVSPQALLASDQDQDLGWDMHINSSSVTLQENSIYESDMSMNILPVEQ